MSMVTLWTFLLQAIIVTCSEEPNSFTVPLDFYADLHSKVASFYRWATFISPTIFMTKYSKSDDQPFVRLALHFQYLWTATPLSDPLGKLFYHERELETLYLDPLLIAELPKNETIRATSYIRPLAWFHDAKIYTSDSRYRFEYVYFNKEYTGLDYARLDEHQIFLIGYNTQPNDRFDLGSPVLGRGVDDELGVAGIILKVEVDGLFRMHYVFDAFSSIKAKFGNSLISKQSQQRPRVLAQLRDYMFDQKFVVPFGFPDFMDTATYQYYACATLIRKNVAVTYSNLTFASADTNVSFYFNYLGENVTSVRLAMSKIGLFYLHLRRSVGDEALLMVLPKTNTDNIGSLPPVRLVTQSIPGRLAYDLYQYVLRYVHGKNMIVGDGIRDVKYKRNTSEVKTNWQSGYAYPSLPHDVGVPLVRKTFANLKDRDLTLFGMIQKVANGKFRVVQIFTTKALGYIEGLLDSKKNRDHLRNTISVLVKGQSGPFSQYLKSLLSTMLLAKLAIRTDLGEAFQVLYGSVMGRGPPKDIEQAADTLHEYFDL